MRKTLLAAAAVAALAAPAAGQAIDDPKVIRLLEIATDPTPFFGTRQEFRCAMYEADLTTALCAVFNRAGQYVGFEVLSMHRLPASARAYALDHCAGSDTSRDCIADISATVVEEDGFAMFRDIEVTWVDLNQ